jgi:hypothetical protein
MYPSGSLSLVMQFLRLMSVAMPQVRNLAVWYFQPKNYLDGIELKW